MAEAGKIGIVLSDMDGTLLDSNKRITPATWAALDALAERSIPFVPCTGRAVFGLPAELRAHPAARYAVSANGATIYELAGDGTPTALHTTEMSVEDALALYDIIAPTGEYVDFFLGNVIYVERPRYDNLGAFVPDAAMLAYMRGARSPIDETLPELVAARGATGVERLSIFANDGASRARVMDYLRTHPELVGVSSYGGNIEVTAVGATKGAGLLWLCDRFGIDPATSVAFGDASNDISMLEVAGDGVAMANASDVAAAAADHRAPSNDEDGVARYLMGLLEESKFN